MSDPGTPPLDWDGVFDRAHRHLYARLALLSIVGGLVALLLLGGGLSARGAIRWRLGPFGNAKTVKKPPEVKVDEKVTAALEPPGEPVASTPPPKRHRKKTPPPVIPPPPPPLPPPPCGGDSADQQYEECPPPTSPTGDTGATGSAGSTENGGTEYVEGDEVSPPTTPDQSGLSNATADGAPTS